MIVTLKSDKLTVKIEDKGAQLSSIRDKEGREYLWQGDPEVWPRRAPLLFPIIGRLLNNKYLLDGVEYTIPMHGFCRDAPFTAFQEGEHTALFTYEDTEETRKVYPFSFRLEVRYTLEGNRLVKEHTVTNRSERPMLYELGGHDGYNAPLDQGERMKDYAVRLPGLEKVRSYGMNEDCLLTLPDGELPVKNGRLSVRPLDYDLDTVVVDRPPEGKALLVDGQDRPRVTVEFSDFDYLGIWTADKPNDTNYVCLEPWSTLPDAEFAGRELGEKPGIRTLQPGESEKLSFAVTFE